MMRSPSPAPILLELSARGLCFEKTDQKPRPLAERGLSVSELERLNRLLEEHHGALLALLTSRDGNDQAVRQEATAE
jgi:hypothetical protein